MVTMDLTLSGHPLSWIRVRVTRGLRGRSPDFHVIQPYEEAEPDYLELSASGLGPIPHYQPLRARRGQQTRSADDRFAFPFWALFAPSLDLYEL